MDAVNLQGLWPTFPGNQTRRLYAVDLYHRLLQDAVFEDKRRKKARKETPKERSRRILDEVILRITQENEDDEFVLLAI